MHKTNKAIAADWRRRAETKLDWKQCPSQAGCLQGEAGGYFVEADGFDRRCYLKPVKPHKQAEQYSRAAREKIAADLAHDLGLSVPPAQLYSLPNPPQDCEAAVVISLVMYPSQHSWETVRSTPLDETPAGLAFAQSLSLCSPMLAFDTWLAQTDHGDHPHNIIWGYDSANIRESKIVFIDYAFAMGFNGAWDSGNWAKVEEAPFPPLMKKYFDDEMFAECLEEIAAYDDEKIRAIVDRIPESHLPAEQKTGIIDGLIGRKELTRKLFS